MDIISDLIARFTSRKFLLVVVGALTVFGLTLSDTQIGAITAMVIAFTAAEGAADFKSR